MHVEYLKDPLMLTHKACFRQFLGKGKPLGYDL